VRPLAVVGVVLGFVAGGAGCAKDPVSSRGKAWFYESGPPYLVNVPAQSVDAFLAAAQAHPDVRAIDEADWGALKD
jgi:hypothetical protein